MQDARGFTNAAGSPSTHADHQVPLSSASSAIFPTSEKSGNTTATILVCSAKIGWPQAAVCSVVICPALGDSVASSTTVMLTSPNIRWWLAAASCGRGMKMWQRVTWGKWAATAAKSLDIHFVVIVDVCFAPHEG